MSTMARRLVFAAAGLLPIVAYSFAQAGGEEVRLPVRSRVQAQKATGDWREVHLELSLEPRQTAILLCDVWDQHWCENASTRCAELARRMEPLLQALRRRGVLVIHAPSECMDFYKDTPPRRRMAGLNKVPLPKLLDLKDPPLPIDDSDGGCDDPDPKKPYRAWKRQHPAITIADEDCISDNGQEIYTLFKERGIKQLMICGVHTNMCVLGRSFGIRNMTRLGIPCILIRDLTDAMYNPKKSPFVSHDEGTELVIQHIEKYWCPTARSEDVQRCLGGQP